MILQLNPPIPVDTPDGPGLAHGWIDYGAEHHLLWVVLRDDGQCWTYSNEKIRGQKNITMGRTFPDCPCPDCTKARYYAAVGT